jgi:hypothetical protein
MVLWWNRLSTVWIITSALCNHQRKVGEIDFLNYGAENTGWKRGKTTNKYQNKYSEIQYYFLWTVIDPLTHHPAKVPQVFFIHQVLFRVLFSLLPGTTKTITYLNIYKCLSGFLHSMCCVIHNRY